MSVVLDTVCGARRKERRVGPGATRPTTAPPHARPAAARNADPAGRDRRRPVAGRVRRPPRRDRLRRRTRAGDRRLGTRSRRRRAGRGALAGDRPGAPSVSTLARLRPGGGRPPHDPRPSRRRPRRRSRVAGRQDAYRAAARGSLGAVRTTGRRGQARSCCPSRRTRWRRSPEPPGSRRTGRSARWWPTATSASPRAAATSCEHASSAFDDRGGSAGLTACIARCLASVMSDRRRVRAVHLRGPDRRRLRRDVSGRAIRRTSPRPVDFLASVAGAGPALELGIGTGRVAHPAGRRGRRGPRHRRVGGDGRTVARETGRRGDPGHDRRLPRLLARYGLLGDLRPVQHVLRAAHPGRSGDVLPYGRPPPHARRRLRDGGVRAGPRAVRSRSTCIGGPRRAGRGFARRVDATTPPRR